MPTNDKDQLIDDIEKAKISEEFLRSPIGRYVESRAATEIESLRDDLETCQKEDFDRLQNEIAIRRQAIGWIIDAILQGQQAKQAKDMLEDSDE